MEATLADSIRIARLRRGWTRRTLAEAAGIGERTVWRIEDGGACHELTVAKLAEALDLDVESLLKLSNTSSVPQDGWKSNP